MNDNMIQDTLLVTPALLVPLLPLIGFLINGLFGKFLPKSVTGWIAALAILGSFICSVTLFNGLNSNSSLNIYNFVSVYCSNSSLVVYSLMLVSSKLFSISDKFISPNSAI